MIGSVLIIDGINYRVIGEKDGVFSLIEMSVDKISLRFEPENKARQNLRNGTWVCTQGSPLVVDIENLPEKERQNFFVRKELMKEIVDNYGPMFDLLLGKKTKSVIDQAVVKYEMSRPTVWRWIRIYLQSGMNDASLVNKNTISTGIKKKPYKYQKRPGRKDKYGTQSTILKDESLVQQFDEALAEYKKGRERTLINSYCWLIENYYSVTPPTEKQQKLPISECPTLKQFYTYASKTISKEEKDRIKTSFAEQRNNKRLLFSSSRIDAAGPGRIMEVDAWEADVQVISEVDGSVIGKPIVYFGIDVYSSVISAMSVSLENNSMVGITNLLLNLSDDKHKFAGGYDFTFDDGLWPSNYLPQEVRCDRGADFKSNKFGEVCHRLGITRTLVSGASGSLKGIVEQSFHQFERSVRPTLESRGLITYQYADNSKNTACMKLSDFTRMALTFVISHNSNPIKDYPMDKKMIREKLITAPCKIWEYGCREYGAPMPITAATRDQYLFNLLSEEKCSISRRGIHKEGLWYCSKDPDLLAKMYTLGNRRVTFTARVDPRDVSCLYYLKGGHMEMLYLNKDIPGQEDFIGMTWSEYKEYLKAKKIIQKNGEEISMNVRTFRRKAYEQTASACASELRDIPKRTEMRTNRAMEKGKTNYENRIATRTEKSTLPVHADNQMTPANQAPTTLYEIISAAEAGEEMMRLV